MGRQATPNLKGALKESKLWPLLSEAQRRVVSALEAADAPTIHGLAAKLGRHRNAVERIINQLVAVGLYRKVRRGREGGGRATNQLILVDLLNVSAVEAIAQALLAQKPNAQAKSAQKANAQLALVHLPPTPLVHLLGDGPISSGPESEDALALSPKPARQNYSGCAEIEPICWAQRGIPLSPLHPPHNPTATPAPSGMALPTPSGWSSDDRDWIESQLEREQLSEGEVDWYDSQGGETVAAPAPRLLAIDPGSVAIGWALLGGPAPRYIDDGHKLVSGNHDQRPSDAGAYVEHLIATHRPTLIVIEWPDHLKDGVDPERFGIFKAAVAEIERAVKAARLPYAYVGASESTRQMCNGDKANVKAMKMEFFARLVGRPTNEHTADAFYLGWTYLSERLAPAPFAALPPL
jgi:hypothetical protein